MEKLRKFKTEEQFLNEKDSLEYPQVSYTEDNEKVWIKEKEKNYFIATYVSNDYENSPFYYWGNKTGFSQIEELYINGILYEGEIKHDLKIPTGSTSIKVIFKENMLTTCHMMFNSFGQYTYIDVSHLDTSNVVNMSRMFEGYNGDSMINVSNFDTSNVVNMYDMFCGVDKNKVIGVENLNLSAWGENYTSDKLFECSPN